MEIDLTQYAQYTEIIISWGMRLLSALAILIVGWISGNWVKKRIFNIKKFDKTLSTFLGTFLKYAILAVSFIAVLGQFGIQTASLLAVLGAAGLAIGLALQGTLSNVAAGVMMLILRPFNVGDYIEAGSIAGTVATLGLFGVELNTPDNKYVYAPNGQIWSKEIINYSRNEQRRQDISFGVSYSSDLDKTIKVVESVLNKDNRLITTAGKEPIVKVVSMGESSINFIARFWSNTPDYFATQWDITKAIKEALDENNIEIPFPTRTLEISNLQALKA